MNIEDGATVTSPVTVIFGLSGMGVAPAGTEKENTGHHHVLVDRPPFGEGPEDEEMSESGLFSDDNHRHFGLVVDDREGLRARMEAAGITFVSDKRFDFLDPWGNRVEVVAYPDIQFLKTREVLDASGHEGLRKSNDALAELKEKGITPPDDA